jgi:hypothetical protein
MTRLRPAGAIALLFSPLLAQGLAQAEVKNFLEMCPGQRLCPYYRLVLKLPPDWVEEAEATREYRMQFLVPRGRTFGNAEALLYVKISPQRDNQELADFIRVSQSRWKESVRDSKITRIEDVTRTNGMPAFVSYRYENPSVPQQAFEAVSFAHDKDGDGNTYVLMVALTGRKKEAIDRAMDAYREFLRNH